MSSVRTPVVHPDAPRSTRAGLGLGVVTRAGDPHSIRGYRDALLAEFERGDVGVTLIYSTARTVPDGVDLVWDPGLGMRAVPPLLARTSLPVVATVHGLRAFSLPAQEVADGWLDRQRTARTVRRVRRGWSKLAPRISRVISVSQFGADEAIAALGLEPARVVPIYHGVDHATFCADGDTVTRPRPYLLMVTQYQPKKNVHRVLEAYASSAPDADLVLIAPGFPDRAVPPGVEVMRTPLAAGDLAAWYRGALGYLCPSLHETFGMPLLEAMACGCPVLTSDATACQEVTADAALHVDPRNVTAIAAGITALAGADGAGTALRADLRARGLEHAAGFTWARSAARHREVFDAALAEARA